jgi:hypothetical protein
MIAKLTAHPDQIRWYVQEALNGFEDLEREDAVEGALHSLRRILEYLDALDAANEAVLVTGIRGIKPGVRFEAAVRQTTLRKSPISRLRGSQFANGSAGLAT